MYWSLKVSWEYISSDKIINLYFRATSAISFKFLQTVPEGLFGELINNNKFLLSSFYIILSVSLCLIAAYIGMNIEKIINW